MIMFTSIWPSTVEGWVGLITLFIGLIGAIVALVPVVIKLGKALKEIVKNKDWNTIKDIAFGAMKIVEDYYKEHPDMSSDDKLEMALDIIKGSCAEVGVELDDKVLEDVVKYIRDTINWFNGMK